MTRIMSIMTGKGGDGKTTCTYHVGMKPVIEDGARVAFVDFDKTPSLSRILLGVNYEAAATGDGADAIISGFSSNNLLTARDLLSGDVEGKRLFDLDMDGVSGSVFLIPGMENVDELADGSVYSKDLAIRGLRKALYTIVKENDLDYIFIDNAPEFSSRQAATLWCASDVIFVTQPEELSVGGLSKLIDHFDEIEGQRVQLSENLNLLGILVNNADNRIASHKTQMGILLNSEGFSDQLFNTVITTRDAFKNCVTDKCFAWDYKSDSGKNAKLDIDAVWKEVKERMESYEGVDEPPLPLEVIEERMRGDRRKEFSYE